jgi:beta-lactamase superfamily II metal-dependent hydrolase
MSTFLTFGPKGLTASQDVQAPTGDVMQFAFIDMGQGDCTMISCPDNTLYVVDCGSSGGLEDKPFKAAKGLVRDWADGNSINMIMTHPDKDHYNKFLELLVYDDPVVDVNCIYFSRAKSDKSPLGAYNQTAMGKNMKPLGYPLLVELTLNPDEHHKKRWFRNQDDYKVAFGPDDIPAEGYVLLDGTTSKGIKWSITVLASNVESSIRTSSEISNAASICTLIKYGDSNLLLTGDANADTLSYLFDDHGVQIKNVTVLQLPHHGSETGSPTSKFKNRVNPISLIVSVGLLNDVFNLPRFSVLEEWKTGSRLRKADLVMDYWKSSMPGYTKFADLQGILVTWKKYTVLNNDSRTFFWLKNPGDAQKAGTEFYGFTNDGFFLFRDNWNKDIWMTGILGSLDVYFKPTLFAAANPPPPPAALIKRKEGK